MKVLSVVTGPLTNVYNLTISKNHTYYVGTSDTLVHDNSLPSTRIVPFDGISAVSVK